MLWSQYKLATIRRTEFLRKQITGIPNIANWNSNFLTLQTSEFQKNNLTGSFGIENKNRIPLMMGVPEIGTKNWNSGKRLFCSVGKSSCYFFCHFCHVLLLLYGAECSCNLNGTIFAHSFIFEWGKFDPIH